MKILTCDACGKITKHVFCRNQKTVHGGGFYVDAEGRRVHRTGILEMYKCVECDTERIYGCH